jgi:hypothetical protein
VLWVCFLLFGDAANWTGFTCSEAGQLQVSAPGETSWAASHDATPFYSIGQRSKIDDHR